jgi:CHAD domain-containing protein
VKPNQLTPVEKFWLTWHRQHGAAPTARRAQQVLSQATSTRAWRDFESKRLDAFPRPGLFLDELLDAARVDMAHARHVADLAVQLFDLTTAVHGLPPQTRALLEAAAFLHNVGVEVDEPNHHTAGRELLRHMNLVNYSAAEQTMLACAVRFHRKKVTPEKEPLMSDLPNGRQAQTLKLSALLRIADGLDYSQSQTTHIVHLHVGPDTVTLHLAGPHADGDGERALEKADLWNRLFEPKFSIATPPPDLSAFATQPLRSETHLSDVARRALAVQTQHWIEHEPAARSGDPAAIKAVRGAARRLRAALNVYRACFKKKVVQRLNPPLKDMEDHLGAVRDWDVLLADAEKFLAIHNLTEAGWIEAWRTRRQAAQVAAAEWLDSPEAQTLKNDLIDFILEPPVKHKRDATLARAAETVLLRPVEPLVERVAALKPDDLETYHALRLAVKRCRFALEFLTPAFGVEAEAILKDVIKAQDRLGALNDTSVAQERLAELTNAANGEAPWDEGMRAYALACADEIQKHLRRFEKDFEPVRPEELRRRLKGLLEQLRFAPSA